MKRLPGRRRVCRDPFALPQPNVESLEVRTLLSAGDLDASFGAGGKVLTDLPGSQFEEGVAVVVQDDDKVVVAGTVRRPEAIRYPYYGPDGDLYGDFVVARYNRDGSRDSTFGGGDGWAVVDFEGRYDVAQDVKLAPDGRIVVAGYSAQSVTRVPGSGVRTSGQHFALARLNADGSPDMTFDGDGRRRVEFGSEVAGVVVRSDGGLFVAGALMSPVSRTSQIA